MDPSYWATAVERPELADGRVLSVFDYQEDWTWWERHPLGDEFVFVLTGELEVLLDDGGRQWSVELYARDRRYRRQRHLAQRPRAETEQCSVHHTDPRQNRSSELGPVVDRLVRVAALAR